MAKYHLTKKAIEDLTNIWNYTYDEWSEEQADQYYHMLLSKCKTISEQPGIGKPYDFIIDSLCGVIANKHVIFYLKIDDETIEIVRILHESMDLKSKFID